MLSADDPAHLGQKLLGARLGSALLKDDVPPGVEERDDRGMVEAALSVRAVADAERGGELAHRVIVGVEQRPAAEIEPVAVRVESSGAPGVSASESKVKKANSHPARGRSGGRCLSIHIMSATIAGQMSLQVV